MKAETLSYSNRNSEAEQYDPLMVIRMAKRLKINLEKYGYVKDLNHSWWQSVFPSFVVKLYNKRFGNRRL